MENIKKEMEENLKKDEIDLLERIAEVLGEDIKTIYYKWSKNDTIRELVEALEKAW